MEVLKRELNDLFTKLEFDKTRLVFEEEYNMKAPRLTEDDYTAYLTSRLKRINQASWIKS
jgi:hypothetical protein